MGLPDSDHSQGLRLEDYLAIAVRRRWWVMGSFFVVGFLGLGAAEKWPLLYRSQALILADQQRVSEQFVAPNVISTQTSMFSSVKQQILSNGALEQLIAEFRLDGSGSRKELEATVEKTRNRISMELVPTFGQPAESAAVQISYASRSRELAQKVTERLTSLFIGESLKLGAQHSESTTKFLQSELEQARKIWAAQEAALRDYKLRYSGQLPNQQQANMQIVSTLQAQLQSKAAELERAEQQQVYLESMHAQYQAIANSAAAQENLAHAAPQAAGTPAPEDAIIGDLEQQLVTLRSRYTADHPDVTKLEAAISEWESRKRQTAAAKPQTAKAAGAPPRADAASRLGEMEVASRLKSVALEIASLRRDTAELRTRLAQYESRLELAPATEQRLSELQQAQEDARIHYESLLQKKLQSEIATNLEKRQQGGRFRIVEPASLPRQPEGKRKIIVLGWLLAIVAGVAAAAVREVTDSTVYNETEAMRYSSIPVLASIPVLRSAKAKRRKHWFSGIEAAAALALVLLAIGAAGHSYFGL